MHKKVLLAEDEPLLRESYQIILQSASYDVDSVINGKEALYNCDKNTYDLILLDIMMPVLDGIGFLKSYRAKFKNRKHKAKIIVLSNITSEVEEHKALNLGAHKFLQKSDLDPHQLIHLLNRELSAF